MISKLISITKDNILAWHNQGLKWFDFKSQYQEQDIRSTIERLSFHNYCGWHLIEEYQNSNKDTVSFVYEGGLHHNRERNNCMERIDLHFYSLQKHTGAFNSEGFGSIFDRHSNDFVKLLHLNELGDPRANEFEKQIAFLENAIEQLSNDIITGQRQVMIFKKFKVKGY